MTAVQRKSVKAVIGSEEKLKWVKVIGLKKLLSKIKKITSGAVSAVLCISGVSWSGLKSTDAAGSVEDKWIFREANNSCRFQQGRKR